MMFKMVSAASVALLALTSPAAVASGDVPPMPAQFKGMDKDAVCSFLKDMAEKASEDMAKQSQFANVGVMLQSLLGDIELDISDKLKKLAPAFGNSNTASKCRMGVDTDIKGDGSFTGDIDVKTSFLGQCRAPYDLSSMLLGTDNILGFKMKNGLDLACRDADSCKCASIASKIEYEASFDEKKMKAYLADSLLGAVLKTIPPQFNAIDCMDLPSIVTKIFNNVFEQLEGSIDASLGFFTCVNGDLKTGMYADFEMVDPMSQLPKDLRKMFEDAGVYMKVNVKAVVQVNDAVTTADIKAGKGVKLFNQQSGVIADVAEDGILTVDLEDGSTVRIPPQQLMDLETSPLPEVGNDSSTDSTVTIIAASAGAACVVAAALVVGIRRKRMRSSLPSASSDTSDIVVKSDPALARPPVASEV